MTAHALLSPSGASRWLACTPSARLETQFDEKKSQAADEGTLAHRLGEWLLKLKLKRVTKAAYSRELVKIQADKLYEPGMLEYIDQYSVFVLERLSEAQVKTPDARIFLEKKLDLTEYVPEGFGTGDVAIIADGILDFIDLKYGKGVPVDAKENKQMMLYALGALCDFDLLFDIDTVRMTIYQPRIDNISTWEISVEDLRSWAESVLKPKATLAFTGEGQFAAGDHCRFCKAKGVCRANAEMNLEVAKYEFKDSVLLKDQEISDILDRADQITKWVAGVQDHAFDQALNYGKKWPGYKLVEGRSNRQYIDEEKVASSLLSEGYKEEQLYTPKTLLGITAMEKAIGKKTFNELLTDLLVKPPGKPALVPDSDKRPELNSTASAIEDFS